MTKRDSFLLRIDPRLLEAIRKWADDEMRSINSQIEFLLRNQLKAAGRLNSNLPSNQNESSPPPTSQPE